MTPQTPLDVQWFVYALICNEQITDEYAQQLFDSLGEGADLTSFAQAVLDQIIPQVAEADQQTVLEQFQQLVEYAASQAETGLPPENVAASAPETPAPEEAAPEGAPDAPAPQAGGISGATRIEGIDFDLSGIHSYEDLPSFSDIPSLSDDQVRERMLILLSCLRHLGCSDMHISSGAPPFVRNKLQIDRIDSYVLTAEDAKRLIFSLLSPEQQETFIKQQDLNLALEVGKDRFRLCLMEQKTGYSAAYRLVPDHICTLEELGFLDKDCVYIKRLLDYNNGLILVTGPIGSGKTTTLAAMINLLNEKRQDHVISVEDPIEILQVSKNCIVTQREIGSHTASYRTALKGALREDPDVIVIGELHDLETIEMAITAAETGHLVIGTLHTDNAGNTLNRLLDVFPPAQLAQIRAMTAGSLRGVICQKLIPDGLGGLTLAYEVLLNTMAIGNLINEGKTFQIRSQMMLANKQGMCIYDQCLLEKYARNLVTREAALSYMNDETTIRQLNSIWAQREAEANRKKKK